MARVYTQEQHAWIAEHYADMTNAELARAFNAEFGISIATQSSMNAYGSNHRLRKAPDVFARRNRKYTDEQLSWLHDFIPGHHEDEIIDAYGERFGERLTVSMVNNLKARLGVRSGTVGNRFSPGHVPQNKGRTWDEQGIPADVQERMRATQFRKGHLSGAAAERKRPLLDIREEPKSGYLQIKVAPRNRKHYMGNWISLAEYEWMAANGRDWPEGHRAVFADRDNRNFSPDNIVPVPAELYPIVTAGAHGHALRWHDRESLEVAITHARVMRRRRELELAPRTCGVCGETFAPTTPNQRTCRACLDAGLRAPTRRRRKST